MTEMKDILIKNMEVFATNDTSDMKTSMHKIVDGNDNHGNYDTIINVYDEDVVGRIIKTGMTGEHVGVMNFANPFNVAGGYWNGSMAQEQALARKSTLYFSLITMEDEYYNAHKNTVDFIGFNSDIIYSTNILFYDNDDLVKADVVSVCAPINREMKEYGYTPSEIGDVIEERILFTLRAMKDNGVTVPILGAFGCGVFGNDSKVVAKRFNRVINRDEFRGVFKEIIFSIMNNEEQIRNFKEYISYND